MRKINIENLEKKLKDKNYTLIHSENSLDKKTTFFKLFKDFFILYPLNTSIYYTKTNKKRKQTTGKFRSIEDFYLLLKSYFNDITIKDTVNIVEKAVDLGTLYQNYCNNVRKRVHQPCHRDFHGDKFEEYLIENNLNYIYKPKKKKTKLKKSNVVI